jgi:hypothetical protein
MMHALLIPLAVGLGRLRRLAATRAAASVAWTLALGLGLPSLAQAQFSYTVIDANQLFRYDTTHYEHHPNTNLGAIGGLAAGESIVDLDIRPATGELYGLAINGLTLRLYRIAVDDTATFAPVATRVGTGVMTLALPGGGFDFDPVNDRARIVGAARESFSVDPDSGAITTLPTLSSGTITGLAFTNSQPGAIDTTLYGIDAGTNSLVLIGNVDSTDGGANGIVTPIGSFAQSPGPGLTAGMFTGLEISDRGPTLVDAMLRASDAVTVRASLYMTTGALLLYSYGPTQSATGLAMMRRISTIYGINTNNQLVAFRSNEPSALIGGTPLAITGLLPGEVVEAMDVRPATGAYYVLTSQSRVGTLDPATGIVTPVAALTTPLSGGGFGMAIDPATDRAFVSSSTSQFLGVDLDSGATIVLPPLSASHVSALAFSPDYPGAPSSLLGLYTPDPAGPAVGSLVNVAPGTGAVSRYYFGFINTTIESTDFSALDASPGDDQLYAATNPPGALSSNLYLLDWYAGAPQRLGFLPIGGGAPLRAMAVASRGYLRLRTVPQTQVTEGPAALPGKPITMALERVGGADGPLSAYLRTGAPGDTATPGTDYVPAGTQYTFRSGETGAKTIVPLFALNDQQQESTEFFTVNLQAAAPGSAVYGGVQAQVIIDDDDVMAPSVEITKPASVDSYAASEPFIALEGVMRVAGAAGVTVSWTSNRGYSGGGSVLANGSNPPAWVSSPVTLDPGVVNVLTVTIKDAAGTVLGTDQISITLEMVSYYLAEGATGDFFTYDLAIANLVGNDVSGSIQFLNEQGPVTTIPLWLGRLTTLRVNSIPGLESQGGISAIVNAPPGNPLVVERTMTWDRRGYGSATDHASDGPSLTWYFAEGAQGFFKTYLLLANPQTAPNVAHVRYLRENEPPVTRDYPLPPYARFTVDAGADAELRFRAFGIEVTFEQPGVAERAMYFGGPPQFLGGHESAGVNRPSRTWFLAEGATGSYFKTYVLIANPSNTAASVTLDFLLSNGDVVSKTRIVAAGARASIDISGEDPRLANAAVATRVNSDTPIVVERAQYWPGGPSTWQEAHNSFGVTSPAYRWGLAEGRMGLDAHYQTYILVANPGNEPAHVTARFERPAGSGPAVEKTFPSTRTAASPCSATSTSPSSKAPSSRPSSPRTAPSSSNARCTRTPSASTGRPAPTPPPRACHEMTVAGASTWRI